MVYQSKYSTQAMFFGSDKEKDVGKNLRPSDPMPKKERDANSAYIKIDKKPSAIECDSNIMKEICKKYSIPFDSKIFTGPSSEESGIKDIIGELFKQDRDATMLIFSGSSTPNEGSFISSLHRKENLGLKQILELWAQRNPLQKHLLLILDLSFAGQWIKDLIADGEITISIQASCQHNQLSIQDKTIGGYFIHNLYKTIHKKITKPIIEPVILTQTPIFFGSFHYIYYYFGLKLKFDCWADMRTAMGASPYGSWPRITAPKPQIVEDKKKTPYLKDSTQALSNFASTKPTNKTESLFVENKHYESSYNTERKVKNTSLERDSDQILIDTFLTPKVEKKIFIDSPLEFLIDKEGKRYEGDVDSKGKKEGFGVLYDQKGTLEYEGQFHNDSKWGKGVLYDVYGVKYYQGDFCENVKSGKGKIFNKNGDVLFEGEFANDDKNGLGIEYYLTKEKRFEGMYKDGKRLGFGTEFYKSGQIKSEGQWYAGLRHGKSSDFAEDGTPLYRGEYKHGQITGKGKLYDLKGKIQYEGDFLNNKYHGFGLVYNEKGQMIQEGIFENGEFREFVKVSKVSELENDEETQRSKMLAIQERISAKDTQEVVEKALEELEQKVDDFGRVLIPKEKLEDQEIRTYLKTKNVNPYKQKVYAPKKSFVIEEREQRLLNVSPQQAENKSTITGKNENIFNSSIRQNEGQKFNEFDKTNSKRESYNVFAPKKSLVEVQSPSDNNSYQASNNYRSGGNGTNVSVKDGKSSAQNGQTTNSPELVSMINLNPLKFFNQDVNQANSSNKKDTVNQLNSSGIKTKNSLVVTNSNIEESQIINQPQIENQQIIIKKPDMSNSLSFKALSNPDTKLTDSIVEQRVELPQKSVEIDFSNLKIKDLMKGRISATDDKQVSGKISQAKTEQKRISESNNANNKNSVAKQKNSEKRDKIVSGSNSIMVKN